MEKVTLSGQIATKLKHKNTKKVQDRVSENSGVLRADWFLFEPRGVKGFGWGWVGRVSMMDGVRV